MLSRAFGPNSIAFSTEQLDFKSAVARAIELLVLDDKVTSLYVAEVLQNLEALGPYFVVAPGIAIAHAPPSKAVRSIGFSLLHLGDGVISGSSNDPVRLLFGFCAPDADSHISLLGEFAETLSAAGKINLLLNASAQSVIRSLLGG